MNNNKVLEEKRAPRLCSVRARLTRGRGEQLLRIIIIILVAMTNGSCSWFSSWSNTINNQLNNFFWSASARLKEGMVTLVNEHIFILMMIWSDVIWSDLEYNSDLFQTKLSVQEGQSRWSSVWGDGPLLPPGLILYLYCVAYTCLYLCLTLTTCTCATCLWASVYLYFCLYLFSCGLPCTVLPPGLVQVCTLCIWPGAKSCYSLDSIPLFALILTHSTLTSPSSLSFGLLLVGAANAFEGKD